MAEQKGLGSLGPGFKVQGVVQAGVRNGTATAHKTTIEFAIMSPSRRSLA